VSADRERDGTPAASAARAAGADSTAGADPAAGAEDPRAGTAPEPAPAETGLELARSIARSLAGVRRGPARGRGARPRRVETQSSGAHPDDRDPQTLDSTIGRLISQQGWGSDVRVHGVFSRWDRIVGRDVAQHARPVSFGREEDGDRVVGRLVVQTDSTAWATQMRLLAGTVVRRLNEELGDGTVTVIDVRGPAAPSWTKGRRSVRDGRGPRDTYG
jgi:predicted nucleic acid-binding Zn ribbon protein